MARIVLDTSGVRLPGEPGFRLPPMTPLTYAMRHRAIPAAQLPQRVHDEFARVGSRLAAGAGDRVAIAVGSRGIANLPALATAVVTELRERGCEPFIVPAMGSHGGATAEGQVEVLAGYGITEAAVGAPVRASMDTVVVGRLDGIDIHFDRLAYEADAVLTISRVKPHTSFRGRIESGIHKMLAIGLGKAAGAALLHRQGMKAFGELIPAAGALVIQRTPYVGSLAVVDDAFHDTAQVDIVLPDELPDREVELLELARDLMPVLPIDDIDVLVVDEVGKDISGGGMDPNVVGRSPGNLVEFDSPRIDKIVVLGLTPATHGHPGAIAMADYIPATLAANIDLAALYTNSIVDSEPSGAQLPVILDSGADAVRAAIHTAHRQDVDDVRIMRIKNTLDLSRLLVSPNLVEQARESPRLEICGPEEPEWSFP